MSDVTRILSAIEQGDPHAAEQLLPLVYDELRKLAAPEAGPGEARADAPGHRPGPRGVPAAGRTASKAQHWDSRGHFFAAAAEAMRRILVDNARRKKQRQARRRRGSASISTRPCRSPTPPHDDLLALDEALTRLAAREPAKAELVKLRYFAGLTVEEAADAAAASRAPPRSATGPTPGPGSSPKSTMPRRKDNREIRGRGWTCSRRFRRIGKWPHRPAMIGRLVR